MKRIVYILDTLSMPGGIARVISRKASWLAEHGYDVTILQTEGSGTDSYFPLSPRVRVVALDINFLAVYDNGRGVAGMLRSAWDRVRKERLFARRCAEFLSKEKYDVIFTAGNHGGLTRIGANVGNLTRPFFHVFLGGLTVDEYGGNARGFYQVDHSSGGSGLHQVYDEHIHAFGDERVDLVGLLGLVILAVHHSHVGIVGFLQVLFKLRAVQGHEVIIELVDANADLDGLAFFGNGRYGQAQQHHNRQCQRE